MDAKAVIAKLFADTVDDDGRWDRDYALIEDNAHLFNETVIEGLLAGAEQSLSAEGIERLRQIGLGEAAQRFALANAERMYELAQRISRVKQYDNLEAHAAHLMAGVAEKRGRLIEAAEGYEMVRKAAKKSGDEKNYLTATFNQARVYIIHEGLDGQAIGLLEEAITLARAHGHDEVLTQGCNFLIHLYEKRGKPQDAERVRAILRQSLME